MSLYGEYGNLAVLKKHLEDQGVKVLITKKEIQDSIVFDRYDMVYMGSGTENAQKRVLQDLKRYSDDLKRFIEAGKIVLFTGNAMELLGRKVGEEEGLGFVDFETEISDRRYTGDVIVHNEELGNIVGFINRSSLITGGEESRLFDYVYRDANLPDNEFEGYHFRNVYGTHIIGPILVKNPAFMELIVKKLLPEDIAYQQISYPYEEESYQITFTELEKRKK